jgi:hypothetical protein
VRRTDLPDYATVRADAVPSDVDAHRRFLDVDVSSTGAPMREAGAAAPQGPGNTEGRFDFEAWVFVRYSRDYVEDKRKAKEAKRGGHAHDCTPASELRAEHR